MSAILPGATLGVLGGGQLGRMFAIAARQMGYRVGVFVPEDDSPTSQVADFTVNANYDDVDAVAEFARRVAVVTFEFENVSTAATDAAERHAPVRPCGQALHIAQHRVREKQFFCDANVPVTPFAIVNELNDLTTGVARLGTPCVLKTASSGYDGKGQVVIHNASNAESAWEQIGRQQAVLEAFIKFDRELSVVGARGLDGQFVSYGPLHNTHANHILDVTVCPFELPKQISDEAVQIVRTIMDELDMVGVLCVEFFHSDADGLMVNEMAPRPHNSGHLTIDAHVTGQFEQQVRSICGLPLGSTQQHRPAAMANLLGDLWQPEPNWQQLCAMDDVKLHLYGKTEARNGRKMGHITALADTAEQATQRVVDARNVLTDASAIQAK